MYISMIRCIKHVVSSIASGNIAGEKMHFIVNHWPSRAAASPARERAGEQVRAIKDSLLREDSAAKIVIMGI